MDNEDFMEFINNMMSNSGLDEMTSELRKANKKRINETRGDLIDFLQADRYKIIMDHQQAQIGIPKYLSSDEYKDSIDLALKLSQLIRLMMEEEQF